jgi:hypothetical protein
MRRFSVVVVVVLAVLASFSSSAQAGSTGILGSWRGELDAGDVKLKVALEIHRLQIGARAGWIRYPGSSCEGPLRLRRETARGGYWFTHRPTVPPFPFGTECTRDRIFARPDRGRLFVRVIPQIEESITHTGRLRRVGCGAMVAARLC